MLYVPTKTFSVMSSRVFLGLEPVLVGDKVSFSRTQHSASGECRTSDSSIPIVSLYQLRATVLTFYCMCERKECSVEHVRVENVPLSPCIHAVSLEPSLFTLTKKGQTKVSSPIR